MARKPAPRIKAAPKRQRRRSVPVRSYCRRKGVGRYFDAAANKAKEWGF